MDDKKKIEEALSESEIQEKKLRAAKAARKNRRITSQKDKFVIE